MYVGIQIESNSKFSMSKAVERFLKTMRNIANERIIFTHQTMQGRCLTFYGNEDIPYHILSNMPLVLDPADPGNNRLYSQYIKEFFVEVLAVKADESLSALKRARHSSDDDLPYLALTVLWPGPFGSLESMPKVMGTPARISFSRSFGSR